MAAANNPKTEYKAANIRIECSPGPTVKDFWPTHLKETLQQISTCLLGSYESSRSNATVVYKTFRCNSHRECPFKVKIIFSPPNKGDIYFTKAGHSTLPAVTASGKLRVPYNVHNQINEAVKNQTPSRAFSEYYRISLILIGSSQLTISFRLVGGATINSSGNAVVDASTDTAQKNGSEFLRKKLINKRKYVRESATQKVVTLGELVSEVLAREFFDLSDTNGDTNLQHIARDLHDTPFISRHERPLLGELYLIASGIGQSGSGRHVKDVPVVIITSKCGLVNIYNALGCSESPIPPPSSIKSNFGYTLSLDGHYRSCRGGPCILTAGLTHVSLQKGNKYGFSYAPLLTCLSVSETTFATSFLLEQLKRIARIFHPNGHIHPARCVTDSSPGLVVGVRESMGGHVHTLRCSYHATECGKKPCTKITGSRAEYRKTIDRFIGLFYQCAGLHIYRALVTLCLDHIKVKYGESVHNTLTSSWITNYTSFGFFHHRCPLETAILAADGTPTHSPLKGCEPSFNNVNESYYSRLANFTTQANPSRASNIGGEDGLVGRLARFLSSHGETSLQARITPKTKGSMRLPIEAMYKKARWRVAEAAASNSSIYYPVETPLASRGIRVSVVSSSKRTQPTTLEQAQRRVDVAMNPSSLDAHSMSIDDFESHILQLHIIVSSPGETLECSCASYTSYNQCSHILIAGSYGAGPVLTTSQEGVPAGPSTAPTSSASADSPTCFTFGMHGSTADSTGDSSFAGSAPSNQPHQPVQHDYRAANSSIYAGLVRYPTVRWPGRPTTKNANPLRRRDTDIKAAAALRKENTPYTRAATPGYSVEVDNSARPSSSLPESMTQAEAAAYLR
ncbi:hypothetical protein FOL47_001367, partial [Perkinsus chesapeaki]